MTSRRAPLALAAVVALALAACATGDGSAPAPTAAAAKAPPAPPRVARVWLEVKPDAEAVAVAVVVKHGEQVTRKVVDELRGDVETCEVWKPGEGKAPLLRVSSAMGGMVWSIVVKQDLAAGKLGVSSEYSTGSDEDSQLETLDPVALPEGVEEVEMVGCR